MTIARYLRRGIIVGLWSADPKAPVIRRTIGGNYAPQRPHVAQETVFDARLMFGVDLDLGTRCSHVVQNDEATALVRRPPRSYSDLARDVGGRPMRGGARLSVCAMVCLSAALPAAASAQTTTWTNPNGGLWHDPANWSNGVPSSVGVGVLAEGDWGVLRIDSPATAAGLVVRATAATVLATEPLQLDFLRIGRPAASTSTVLDGQVAWLQGSQGIVVGDEVGAETFLSVRGDVAHGWCNLQVGGRGIAHVDLGGSDIEPPVGISPTLRIEAGSTVGLRQNRRGWFSNEGRLSVAEGAVLEYRWSGSHPIECESFGTLEVIGPGSRVAASVYGEPHGIVTVRDGGTLGGDPINHEWAFARAEFVGAGSSVVGIYLRARECVIGDNAIVHLGQLLDAEQLVVQSGGILHVDSRINCDRAELSSGATVITDILTTPGCLQPDWRLPVVVSDPGTILAVGEINVAFEVALSAMLRGVVSAHTGRERLDICPWGAREASQIQAGGLLATQDCVLRRGDLRVEAGGLIFAQTLKIGDISCSCGSGSSPQTLLVVDPGARLEIGITHVARVGGATFVLGVLECRGEMTGNITLDGILRPSGFVLDGGVTASSTGLTEISLDVPIPAITATGACNLGAGLTIVTRDGPTLTGDTRSIIHAGSLSLGDIALPTLPPDLEWDLTQTPTSLSITAVAIAARCRPSVERLSPAAIDGYISDPIQLAAAVSGPVMSMRWHKDGLPLADGGIYAGATTPTLTIASGANVNLARYHLIATGPCGKTASLPIDASIRCGGDFNRDSSVDGDDVIDFFGPWDAGEIEADWNHDGAVDGDDVIGFFERWDSGC